MLHGHPYIQLISFKIVFAISYIFEVNVISLLYSTSSCYLMKGSHSVCEESIQSLATILCMII